MEVNPLHCVVETSIDYTSPSFNRNSHLGHRLLPRGAPTHKNGGISLSENELSTSASGRATRLGYGGAKMIERTNSGNCERCESSSLTPQIPESLLTQVCVAGSLEVM